MFAWKTNEYGRVVKAKARLVARGFGQRAGVDFFETFSPCPGISSMRLLAAIACELGWDICHVDAQQAFVQSDLDEEVYIRSPQGCGALSGKVVKLDKILYGLRQASRTWHHHLVRGMKSLGFEQSPADACVMRLIENGDVSMLVVVHVDDIYSIGRKSRGDQFGRDLNKYVPIDNLGELRWFAGCRFEQDKRSGTIKMSQPAYALETVEKFGVVRSKDLRWKKV